MATKGLGQAGGQKASRSIRPSLEVKHASATFPSHHHESPFSFYQLTLELLLNSERAVGFYRRKEACFYLLVLRVANVLFSLALDPVQRSTACFHWWPFEGTDVLAPFHGGVTLHGICLVSLRIWSISRILNNFEKPVPTFETMCDIFYNLCLFLKTFYVPFLTEKSWGVALTITNVVSIDRETSHQQNTPYTK